MVNKKVLLVGLMPNLVEEFRKELDLPNVELLAGTGVDDIRAAFAQTNIDHVFLGGGLDLDVRAQAIGAVFESSDNATFHLKDAMSGPEGFVPFARAVLRGLDGYELHASPRAILRARRPGPTRHGNS
jgi:hypothetical protein